MELWPVRSAASFRLLVGLATLFIGWKVGDSRAAERSGWITAPLPEGISREDLARVTTRTRERLHQVASQRFAQSLAQGMDAEAVPDVVVFVDESGRPVLPDRERAGATPASGDLTFQFDSPTYPWSPSELATLQAYIASFYPLAKTIYGAPAFADTVNVRKDPTSPVAGYYSPSGNELALQSANTPDVFCHEMIHAFRDDYVLGLPTYEEGMTRAAEVAVFDALPAYTHWDEGHSYPYDVFYEGLNEPAIGSRNGQIFNGYVSPLLRYQLAGYAWGKGILETPDWLQRFNDLLYARLPGDPALQFVEPKMRALVEEVLPAMEGQPITTWYDEQFVLLPDPPTGYMLYHRINQFTVDFLYRNPSGPESPLGGYSIDWAVYDCNEFLRSSGTTVTGPNGFIFYSPSLPGYSGRIRASASVQSPEGLRSQSAYRYWGSDATGVFGVLEDWNSGTVTVSPMDTAMAPISVPVVNGGFAIPSLGGVRGRFGIRAAYSDGRTAWKVFTKDRADYYVRVRAPGTTDAPTSSPGGMRLRAQPSVSAAGVQFLLEGALERPGWLEIHDTRGRIVHRVHLAPGDHGWQWDGRSSAGERVASGAYVARLSAGGLRATARFVILR